MQLCVPVTDIFKRNREKLLPLVGAVSFKEPSSEVYEGKEHMLECSLNIVAPNFETTLEETGLADALRSGHFSSFACDLGPAWQDFNANGRSPNNYPRYLPGIYPISEEYYIEAAQQNVRILRSIFHGKIKVENLNYFPTGAYELVCEAEFISRIVRGLGIELLLDMGHTAVSIQNLGVSHEKFLDQLPLDTVTEIQISGSRWINGVFEDAHELPSKRDMELLAKVVGMSPVEYITLEYYKDDEPLVEAYEKLYKNLADSSVTEMDSRQS